MTGPAQASSESKRSETHQAGGFEPRLVAFVCNWCTYAGAALAGTTRLRHASNVRIIRVPCTGRVSPEMLLKAFEQGADGVLVSGCHPQDCHFASGNRRGRRPNLTARRRWIVLRRLVEFVGIDPRRMQFAWVSASEGRKWADLVDEVVARLRQAGPFTEYHRLDRMPVSL